MNPLNSFLSLALLFTGHAARAALPQIDFERMGTVGLAGAFAGLDIFSASPVSFDPTSSTLLSRANDGSLTRIASTNSGGSILAGCSLGKTYYVAGSFSAINGTSISNIAAYNSSPGSFSQLGSGGPDGAIHALYCDASRNKIWVGGKFSSPGSSIAIFDVKTDAWSGPPFGGISGAQSLVKSISLSQSGSSLLFAGSFVASFGNGSTLNGTNNPNVPYSPGASPFSSSLVPIPLQNVQVDGSPSSSQVGFSDIKNTLCPSGADGPGNTWLAADGSTPLITVRTFSFISANGVRLGNTFQSNHGTTGFTVTTIPDNTVRTLKYLDPTTKQNVTCETCPLSTDSSILYQDFLFDQPLAITGVQIKLTSFTGSSPGLHVLQLLSSGAFASSIADYNRESCYAPNPSNTTQTESWIAKVANTDIAGTVQTVLVSSVAVGTPSASGPTFTWIPYVSAAGDYDINLLVPGCTNFQDCSSRTSVKVTVFPGANLSPFITEVSQQNPADAIVLLYSGPILPSSPDFVTTISMALSDSPAGSGQGGRYELVADRVQLVLKSANINATSAQNGSSGSSGSSTRSFGFLEWPVSQTTESNFDGRTSFPNSSLTSLDALGVDVFSGLGGAGASSSSTNAINVITQDSGDYYIGGLFTLSSGPASGSSNIVAFKNGVLTGVADGGLDGEVLALAVSGDQLYVAGSFKGTHSGLTNNLNGIALYNVQKNTWSQLGAGVNGVVTSLVLVSNQLQVAGNFTRVLSSVTSDSGVQVPGIAVWDIKSGSWMTSGGFINGRITFIDGSSSPQYMAGNVAVMRKYGASGLVMLKNGNANGPQVSPFAIGLGDSVQSPSSPLSRRESLPALTEHLHQLFGRQSSSSSLANLPTSLPAVAPAVLHGAFWSNSSSSKEVIIFGGNFSFVLSGASTASEAIAIYDPDSRVVQGLTGTQPQGTVRTLLVDGNSLWVGGEFTLPGSSINGLALYDLSKMEWDLNGLQSLQPSSGSTVVVRSISKFTLKPNTIVVAGSFAQAGSLRCQGICSFDTQARQWNALGDGIQGEVVTVAYAGSNREVLIAGGSIALSDNNPSNVAMYSVVNATWKAVGSSSDIPGPVEALEVNNSNSSSLFAAGRSPDGSTFLSFWNGVKWSTLGSSFSPGTMIADLTMVPLTSTHTPNGIIEPDRVLMISGALSTTEGNASSVLYDGQNIIPYFVSSTASGTAGSVSSLFHSFKSFSFNQRKFLATGVVILISIALAAGVVFLIALIGILWTLFSRKDERTTKFDPSEEDDDSAHHRPSSLLEHINAATRTTILGPAAYSTEKEGENTSSGSHNEPQDPFGPDASNYIRAETPSDAMGGIMAEETSRPAHARYSFDGTGEGELALSAGAEVEVLDDKDPAWWYARDIRTGREGVVPAAYLY